MKWRSIFFLYYLPALLWMAAIFSFSSATGSAEQYEYPKMLFLERKGAHVAEFFLLTILLLRITFLHWSIAEFRGRAVFWAVFAASWYAVSDEFHQLFVFGRTGKIDDVLIDALGIALATVVFWKWRFRRAKRQDSCDVVENVPVRIIRTRRRVV